MSRLLLALLAPALLTGLSPARAHAQEPLEEALPRYLTEREAAWLAAHPGALAPRAVTPPPVGPVTCPAEYEPMEGLVIAWEGPSSWTAILARIAAQVTTVGDGDIWVAVDTASEATTATNAIAAQGANMARVTPLVVTTDSIWMRDYGPRYVYQGGVRAVVDHTYNRPRPRDNQFPTFFAGYKDQARYELPLTHGGGNFHLDANGNSFVTRLILNENPGLTEPQVRTIWSDYQNLYTNFFQPFPKTVDSTQHIDMWMQVIADDRVVISDWPNNVGSVQDQICDAAAIGLANAGFTVHRTPAFSVGGTHYTYTNVVMCNDLVLVPSYTNATVSPSNAAARAVWEAALPTKTIVPLNAQGIVTAAGVFHCIVMHVPEPAGGAIPTAYLVGDEGGGVLTAGSTRTIEWISDDDRGVTSVDLELSLDGGQTYPTVIAAGLSARGSLNWVVPSTSSSRARLRAVARDADGNTGSDESDADWALQGTAPLAASTGYGTGKPGTLGVPSLTSSLPILGAPMTLDVASALPNATVGLLYGFAPAAIPFDGTTILVNGVGTLFLPSSGAGTLTIPLVAPGNLALAGLSLYWQAWVQNDPAAAGMGWAASAGLETRLGL